MGYKDICSNAVTSYTVPQFTCASVYASGETGMMAHLWEGTVTYVNTYMHT